MDDTVLPAGKYIVAVSGGVDSVVLLDVLSKQKTLKLIVAHFDHGMRDESADDARFVSHLAKQYGFPFETSKGRLGKDANEETARHARYAFLESVRTKHKAKAIITAHHQDDVIETIIFNLLRGTGRKGVVTLKNSEHIMRPLLSVSKAQIKDYAEAHNLPWHEDKTNQDTKYSRNWIRHEFVPKMSGQDRGKLLGLREHLSKTSEVIDDLLAQLLDATRSTQELSRLWFISLPHAVAKELLITWLARSGVHGLDKVAVEKLVTQLKTLRTHKYVTVLADWQIEVQDNKLVLIKTDSGQSNKADV